MAPSPLRIHTFLEIKGKQLRFVRHTRTGYKEAYIDQWKRSEIDTYPHTYHRKITEIYIKQYP